MAAAGGARDGLPGVERVEGEAIHVVAIHIHQRLSLKTYENTLAVTPSRGTLPRGVTHVEERRSL